MNSNALHDCNCDNYNTFIQKLKSEESILQIKKADQAVIRNLETSPPSAECCGHV